MLKSKFMHFIDFHTHLDWYANQKDLFLQFKNFKGKLLAASVDELSFLKNIEIVQKAKALGYGNAFYDDFQIIPTFGIHPKNALKVPENLKIYDKLCEKSQIIGEIGMDFCWYKNAGKKQQEKVFRYFLEHCNKFKKYCVIHTKGAEQQICNILSDYPNAKPIIHWYDGSQKIYNEFIKRGYLQTFGCETIRSKKLQQYLLQTPREFILAETDNPDSEIWLGGNDNSVFLIERIYKDIAEVLSISAEKCAKIINKNANNVLQNAFGKKCLLNV